MLQGVGAFLGLPNKKLLQLSMNYDRDCCDKPFNTEFIHLLPKLSRADPKRSSTLSKAGCISCSKDSAQ